MTSEDKERSTQIEVTLSKLIKAHLLCKECKVSLDNFRINVDAYWNCLDGVVAKSIKRNRN